MLRLYARSQRVAVVVPTWTHRVPTRLLSYAKSRRSGGGGSGAAQSELRVEYRGRPQPITAAPHPHRTTAAATNTNDLKSSNAHAVNPTANAAATGAAAAAVAYPADESEAEYNRAVARRHLVLGFQSEGSGGGGTLSRQMHEQKRAESSQQSIVSSFSFVGHQSLDSAYRARVRAAASATKGVNWQWMRFVTENDYLGALEQLKADVAASGAALTTAHINPLIEAFAAHSKTAAAVQLWIRIIANRLLPDSLSCEALMYAYHNSNDAAGALDLLANIAQYKIEPTPLTLVLMFKIFIKAGDGVGALDAHQRLRALGIVKSLKQRDAEAHHAAATGDPTLAAAAAARGGSTSNDAHRLNITWLIYEFARAGHTQTALNLFLSRGATSTGAAANIHTFNALLYTFHRDVHTCEVLFNEMCTPSQSQCQQSIAPNAETYSSLIRAHAFAGNMPEVDRYYKLAINDSAILHTGAAAVRRLHVAYIGAHLHANDIAKAEALLWTLKPAIHVAWLYELLMRRHANAGSYSGVERLIQRARVEGHLPPQVMHYNFLFRAMQVQYERNTPKSRVPPVSIDSASPAAASSASVSTDSFSLKRMLDLYKAMRADALVPTQFTYEALARPLADSPGHFSTLRGLIYNDMSRDGIMPSPRVVQAFLLSTVRHPQHKQNLLIEIRSLASRGVTVPARALATLLDLLCRQSDSEAKSATALATGAAAAAVADSERSARIALELYDHLTTTAPAASNAAGDAAASDADADTDDSDSAEPVAALHDARARFFGTTPESIALNAALESGDAVAIAAARRSLAAPTYMPPTPYRKYSSLSPGTYLGLLNACYRVTDVNRALHVFFDWHTDPRKYEQHGTVRINDEHELAASAPIISENDEFAAAAAAPNASLPIRVASKILKIRTHEELERERVARVPVSHPSPEQLERTRHSIRVLLRVCRRAKDSANAERVLDWCMNHDRRVPGGGDLTGGGVHTPSPHFILPRNYTPASTGKVARDASGELIAIEPAPVTTLQDVLTIVHFDEVLRTFVAVADVQSSLQMLQFIKARFANADSPPAPAPAPGAATPPPAAAATTPRLIRPYLYTYPSRSAIAEFVTMLHTAGWYRSALTIALEASRYYKLPSDLVARIKQSATASPDSP